MSYIVAVDCGLNHSHHTTVHQQVLSCYVGGIIRKEERRRLRELLQPPDPLHWNRVDDALVQRIGVNEPRQNRIHPNPVGSSGLGMDPRPSRERHPEDTRDRSRQLRLLRCVAGDIEKCAVLLAKHHRHDEPRQSNDAAKNQLVTLLPIGIAQAEEFCFGGVSRVVDNRVYAPEALDGYIHQLLATCVAMARPMP